VFGRLSNDVRSNMMFAQTKSSATPEVSARS
jgi:hypothetical protein